MLKELQSFADQVTGYGTVLGQIWCLCVFLYRGIVVATIGSNVYGDEQSQFKCSTKELGCENVCFSNFSKISHIRFWAFQVLAVSTPTILFHFFVAGVKTRLVNVKADDDGETKRDTPVNRKRTAERGFGRIHIKSVYDLASESLKEVTTTDSIHVAYFINVILRVVIEGIFLHFSYELFKFPDYSGETREYGKLDFLWFRVPALYLCQGPEVFSSCHQHVGYSKGGYVSCWVSRPWEKTIFLRYMNAVSCICFLLSAVEFVYLFAIGIKSLVICTRKKRKRVRNIQASSWEYTPDMELSAIAIPIKLNNVGNYVYSTDSLIDFKADFEGGTAGYI